VGVTLPHGLKIAEYRATVFKEGLRAFRRTHSPTSFVELRSVFGSSRDGAIVFEECLDRGLIVEDDEKYELSAAGETMAGAKAGKRAPLSRALALVDELLDRAADLNADTQAVNFVDQIWLFGSTMRGEETVGDIDMAIVTHRRPPFDADWRALRAQVDRLLAERDDVPTVRSFIWSGEEWLVERALFGKRRHPLLAGVHFDLRDLKKLGVPCRLIFDRKRGGRVDDNIMARHPDSPGRSNEIDPPRTLPSLAPNPLRPMDGRWITNYKPWGTVSPYDIFGGWNDAAHALFPRYPEGLRVVADGHDKVNTQWTPKRVHQSGLDGRSKVAVFKQNWWGGLGLVLCREILTSDPIELIARLESLELFRVRSQLQPIVEDVASAIALILACDGERIVRREMEQGRITQVQISIDATDIKATLREPFLDQIERRLAERIAKIEPNGWEGPPVKIFATSCAAA
jgi:predicted nucleotidyltransferase